MYRRTRIRTSREIRIWLRAHCADAATHRPVAASRFVYVELRDDRGELARRIKLMARDSVYSGYLPTQSLERFGDYSLTAYTLYMRNPGPDYFFKKPLTIPGPIRRAARRSAIPRCAKSRTSTSRSSPKGAT